MLKNSALLIVKLYQTLISPLLPQACRFYPSCSEYSRISITKYGFFKGIQLTVIRLCKCHPLHPGGFDPVP